MPNAAIQTGVVDFILSLKEIGPASGQAGRTWRRRLSSPPSPEQFEGLLEYLHRSRGFDFTAYKRSSLERLVQKRIRAANLDGYSAYGDYLEAHPAE
jgi:hypothetical protein